MNLQTVLPLLLALKGSSSNQKNAPSGGFDVSKLPEMIEKLKSGDVSALFNGLNLDDKTKAMFQMIASFGAAKTANVETAGAAVPAPPPENDPKPASAVPNEINQALKKLMEKNT